MDFQPVQVVVPSLRLKVPLVDLSRLPPAERECEATRLANEEAQRCSTWRKVRSCALACFGLGARTTCFLRMHHIVSDGWSMGIFWNELSAIWSAFAQGRPSPLPELSLQYADLRSGSASAPRSGPGRAASLLKKNLAGAPVTELPYDFARPANPGLPTGSASEQGGYRRNETSGRGGIRLPGPSNARLGNDI